MIYLYVKFKKKEAIDKEARLMLPEAMDHEVKGSKKKKKCNIPFIKQKSPVVAL